MTTAEFIKRIRDYFGEWERPAIMAVVAGVVDKMAPEVREVVCNELMRTIETRWKHTPDWADIDKVLNESQAVRRVRMEIRSDRQRQIRERDAKAIDVERNDPDAVEVPENWRDIVRDLARNRKAQ